MTGNLLQAHHRRSWQLDTVRGFAIICMYIDHVPGNIMAAFTIRAFGFSDASEIFVLVSGFATGCAYKGLYAENRSKLFAQLRSRLVKLYVAQMLIAIATISVFIWARGAWPENVALASHPTVSMLPQSLADVIAGIITLLLQPGYLHVLPFYIVILLWIPVALHLAERSIAALFAVSLSLWIGAQFGWQLPAIGEERGWYFNPMAWQLLFTIGLMAGAAPANFENWLRSRWLCVLSVAFLVLAFLVAAPWTIFTGHSGMTLPETGWLPATAKQNLWFIRLINVLCLAFVFTYFRPLLNWDWLIRICGDRLSVIGRHGLLCFCAATILAEWLVVVRTLGARGFTYQASVNAGGILLLGACAKGMESAKLRAWREGSARFCAGNWGSEVAKELDLTRSAKPESG